MRQFLYLVVAATLCAQSFEVTSVKVNRSGNGSTQLPRLVKGKLTATHSTMRWILQAAYGLGFVQISGPGWLDDDSFDLTATSPAGVPDTEIKPMLQALLKDRFGLVAHIETKEMPVYNMVVAKEGLKIKLFDPNGPPPPRPVQMSGAVGATNGQQTMAQIANALAAVSGRPVIDKTGLEGRYLLLPAVGSIG